MIDTCISFSLKFVFIFCSSSYINFLLSFLYFNNCLWHVNFNIVSQFLPALNFRLYAWYVIGSFPMFPLCVSQTVINYKRIQKSKNKMSEISASSYSTQGEGGKWNEMRYELKLQITQNRIEKCFYLKSAKKTNHSFNPRL